MYNTKGKMSKSLYEIAYFSSSSNISMLNKKDRLLSVVCLKPSSKFISIAPLLKTQCQSWWNCSWMKLYQVYSNYYFQNIHNYTKFYRKVKTLKTSFLNSQRLYLRCLAWNIAVKNCTKFVIIARLSKLAPSLGYKSVCRYNREG
jgi:hypothetical protein